MEILGFRKATKNVPACGAQCYRSDDVFCFVVSMKIDIIIPVPVQIDQTIIKFHTLNKEFKEYIWFIILDLYSPSCCSSWAFSLYIGGVHTCCFCFWNSSFTTNPSSANHDWRRGYNLKRSTSSYWRAFLFSLSCTFHLLTRLTRFPYIVISVCSKFNSENEWTLSSFHFILIQIPSITWSNNASPSSLEKKFGHHFNVEWISIFISSNFGVSLNSNLLF